MIENCSNARKFQLLVLKADKLERTLKGYLFGKEVVQAECSER